MEWVSAKERLPETSGAVIAVAADSGWIWAMHFSKEFGLFNVTDDPGTAIPVTHWMPMPEAPKAE